MDRVIEKTKKQRLMKHWPYAAGGCLVLVIMGWLIFGNHASTLRVSKDELTISEVRSAEFKGNAAAVPTDGDGEGTIGKIL